MKEQSYQEQIDIISNVKQAYDNTNCNIATIITPFIFHEALMGEWYWPLITGAGFCGLLAFKAYALYQNYNYAWDYNDDLYTLLFEGPELALVPFYNLEEETLGTTLIASINF